ncbi:ABC transporter substrate-binding protein [Paenibacillus senegalensis]|uniref:ABC transporter substrate-binding protein n=1 Tax=Paenibacillus senegalensis TaxID=1465766 RepID=UPI0002883281|nr:iron-siderophore ABC transporter substrate-binding protein [Paenibacillus senegalensis]
MNRLFSKRVMIFALLSILLVALAACANGGDGGEAASPSPAAEQGAAEADRGPDSSPAPDGSPASDGEQAQEGKRIVKHAMGEKELTGTPVKVVTLFQGATDSALLLGVQPAGAVESWIEQPWYHYIRDQMEGVTNLGSENQPNLEAITLLKPDVIIASKTRHEKIYDQLDAIAPTVMTEEVHIWRDSLAITAAALNKQEEEQAFLQEWEQKIAEFKEKMGDRLSETEVAVVDFRSDHVRIVYTGFAALVLDELGISRPDNQKGEEWGVKLTSSEHIPQMNADIIFDQTSLGRDDGRLDLRNSWMSHPLWANLRAVQNGKVFEVDTAVWNNGSGPIAATLMVEDLFEYLEVLE